MIVSFEATHIVDVVEVTPDLKQYYENLIAVFVRSFLDADTGSSSGMFTPQFSGITS